MNVQANIHIPDRGRSIRLRRSPIRALSFRRLLVGGRVDDLGRLPRYLATILLLLAGIWSPIVAYINYAPLRFTSDVSLILPGAGASSSVNLSDIGQASSYSNSPYASPAVSPTVTYQRLISADHVLRAAAGRLQTPVAEFGKPRVKLVDQTALILFGITGADPEEAQRRAAALTAAFLAELDRLRADELSRRETSARSTIQQYQEAVATTRSAINELQLETGLISVAQYNEIVSQAEELQARVREVEAQLRLREGSIEALTRMLEIAPSTAAMALKLHADEEYRALSTEMSARAAALAVAPSNLGDKHPELIAARDSYAGARKRLYRRAEAITGLDRESLVRQVGLSPDGERAALLSRLVTLVSEREGLASELASLSQELDESRSRMLSLVDPASRLDDLNRDYQVAEAVFASALARSDTSKSDIYASYPLVQVLEEPTLPEHPSSPRRMIAIAAGTAASLCLLVALMLAWLRRPIVSAILKSRDEK